MTKYLILFLVAGFLMLNAQAHAADELTQVNPVQLASAGPGAQVDDVAAAKALRAFLAAQRPVAPIAAADLNGRRR